MAGSKPALFERAQQAEQKGNREVRDLWDRYAGHRQHLTDLLLGLGPGRLCVLGAGNGNDLDFEALARRFDEIHLVDIDPGALSRAAGRQRPATRARLRSHAPVDLSGLYHQLALHRPPSADALVAAGAAEVLRQLPLGFDVVASCCVLSQMSWALENLVAGNAPPLDLLQQVLARIHLRTLLALLAPSGTALLAADMVSSDVYALDELPEGEDLAALASRIAAERVAFPVSNPELLRQILRKDSECQRLARPVELAAPWLWSGPKGLTYLVCPILLRRAL
jgi:hypothetical protein